MSEQNQSAPGLGSGGTRLERIMVWAGGYHWQLVDCEPPEHRAPIRILGAAVFTAAAIAATNWAIAAYAVTGGEQSTKVIAAALAGMIALAVVLMLDRGTIFLADIMVAGRRYALVLWVTLRMAVTLVVSAITAQSTMPLIFGSDLRLHALHMGEASETKRLNELNNRFEVTGKRRAATEAADEIVRVQQQASVLPIEVRNRQKDAARCWEIYRRRKLALVSGGVTDAHAQDFLKIAAAGCSAKQSAAKKDKEAYESKMRSALQDAEVRKAAAEIDAMTAIAAVSARVDQASAIEKEALNPWSVTVLSDLIASNPTAKLKWALITFGLVSLELLPLLMKLLMGRTAMGLRMSTNHAIEDVFQNERVSIIRHDRDVTRALGDVMRESVLRASEDPDVQRFCAQQFAGKLRAFVPLEVVTALLRDIELKHADVDQAIRRYPRYAGAISQVWSQAMRDVVDLYAGKETRPQRSTGTADAQPRAHAA